MILLIDNYDSFTWNLYQYFCELGAEVLVRRNDALTLEEIAALAPEKIVISPGPCTPDEAGISLAVIRHYAGKTPLLGVCLGHQAIAQPTLPFEFNVTARSASGEIMGIRHREWDLEGVQFHPESILSEQGHQLLANFLKR